MKAGEHNKTSFLIYHDVREPLMLLTDTERGQLLMAMLNYSQYGQVPDFSGELKMAFAFVRLAIDRDAASWEDKRAKRREAGSLGGKQRAANQANASFAKHNQASEANQAVPVPVSVPVPAPVIESIVSSYEETCPEPEVPDGGKTKKKRREPEPLAKDHWAYKSAVWLSKRIRKRLPNIKEPTEKDIQRWARDIEKIERIDGYDKEIVSDILIFSQEDQFWQKNILSGDALRRNFDKLIAKEASTHNAD